MAAESFGMSFVDRQSARRTARFSRSFTCAPEKRSRSCSAAACSASASAPEERSRHRPSTPQALWNVSIRCSLRHARTSQSAVSSVFSGKITRSMETGRLPAKPMTPEADRLAGASKPMRVPGASGAKVERMCSGICRSRTGATALSCSTCVPAAESNCSSG